MPTKVKQSGRKLSLNPANVARRRKYAADPSYRVKVLARSKEFKKGRYGTERSDFHSRMLHLASLEGYNELLRFGKRRPSLDGATASVCFTIAEIAAAIGKTAESVVEWKKRGYLPGPDQAVRTLNGRGWKCYSVVSVRKILAMIGALATKEGQLRDRHKAEAIRLAR